MYQILYCWKAYHWIVTKVQWSVLLPGEPTAMWHFFSLILSWFKGVPPMKTWHSKPSILIPIVVITAWICTAISLVGAKTRIWNKELGFEGTVTAQWIRCSLSPLHHCFNYSLGGQWQSFYHQLFHDLCNTPWKSSPVLTGQVLPPPKSISWD